MSVDRPGLIDSMISDVNASGYLPPVPLRNNDTLKPDKSINHEAKKMLRKLKNEAVMARMEPAVILGRLEKTRAAKSAHNRRSYLKRMPILS